MLLTRTPLYSRGCPRFLVRLACVRHAASVDSEPGSNSRLKLGRPHRCNSHHKTLLQHGPKFWSSPGSAKCEPGRMTVPFFAIRKEHIRSALRFAPKQRNPHSNSALCLHTRIDVACSTQLSRSRSVREDRTPLPGVSGDSAFHCLPSLCRNFSQQTIIKIIRHASCCQDLQFSSVEKFPLICTLS